MEELKKVLIDLYTCLCFALNGGNLTARKTERIVEHFPFVATFVVYTCSE
jgi:hypothetical protein